MTIVLDGRLGRIEGRLEAAGRARALGRRCRSRCAAGCPPRTGSAGPFQMMVFRTVTADKDGAFRFDDLPPGTYEITPAFGPDAPFSADPVAKVEVGPNAVARVEVPLERHVTITGRVVDARTGRGIAGVGVRSGAAHPAELSCSSIGAGADRRRRPIHDRGTRRGRSRCSLSSVPKAYLGLRSSESPQAGGPRPTGPGPT